MAKGKRNGGISLRKEKTASGETTLYARFYIPERSIDGEVSWRRTERSTRTSDKRQARQYAQAIIDTAYERLTQKPQPVEIEEVAPEPPPVHTFAHAALTYMQTTGITRFIAPLLRHFGSQPVEAINQSAVVDACAVLYPGRTAQTLNRQVYTPIIAILNLDARTRNVAMPAFVRPRGWDHKPPIKTPKDEWFDKFLPAARPEARALALIWTLHNARVEKELLGRTPEDFNPESNTLYIGRTKNGEPVELRLAKPASEAIKAYDWRKGPWLFGTNQKSTVYKWIRAACQEAGIPYYTPYQFGKHRFASRHLERGKSLKWVQEAGRWKTIKMVAERYGHLERREVENEMNEFSEKWAEGVSAPKRLTLMKSGGKTGGSEDA